MTRRFRELVRTIRIRVLGPYTDWLAWALVTVGFALALGWTEFWKVSQWRHVGEVLPFYPRYADYTEYVLPRLIARNIGGLILVAGGAWVVQAALVFCGVRLSGRADANLVSDYHDAPPERT